MFERHTHWIERDLNSIAERFDKEEPQRVEFHGNPMRSGKGIWRHQQPTIREQAIVDALALGVRDRLHRPRLFAVVLEKVNHPGKELAELAFEQLSSRFDMYIRRLYLEKDVQRGIMVFDKCSTEQRIQTLSRELSVPAIHMGNCATLPRCRSFWIHRHHD